MRIIVVSSYIPFVESGHVALVEALERALKARKHEVDSVLLPFNPRWSEITQQLLAVRSLDLTHASGHKVDLLITLRPPAYAVMHDNKVCWLHDQYRGVYQRWGMASQDIPGSPEGEETRQALVRSDRLYLSEHRKLYTVASRLDKSVKQHHKLETGGVLLSPLPNPEPYHDGKRDDYLVYAGPFTPGRRQTLLIDAMRRVRSPFRLVLASTEDAGTHEQQLRQLIEKHSLESKIVLQNGLAESEKAEVVSHALAALDIAGEDDCCDYTTLEAFHAHRLVITCTDSPGSQELIDHEHNGFVVEPEADALAETMESIWSKRALAADLGENAHRTLAEKQLDWSYVVEKLIR